MNGVGGNSTRQARPFRVSAPPREPAFSTPTLETLPLDRHSYHMTKKTDKPGWTGKAAMTGAAIGSAALAAALLYASRRKERADAAKKQSHPEDAPETD